jgi:homoserine dehydrogenase
VTGCLYFGLRLLLTLAQTHDLLTMVQASCGAGLPILSTLKALVESGDKVIAIEGILSGTLSYIFNTWQPGQPFSEVVLKAKELGFTEPDPREDLSGSDVARKVRTHARELSTASAALSTAAATCAHTRAHRTWCRTDSTSARLADSLEQASVDILLRAVQVTILARECGAEAVLEDLAVDSLVPEALRDVDESTYLEKLPSHDADMAAQLEEAQAAGDVLRYIGKYDAKADACSITLARYPSSHPFAALKGTDNIVQIRSERYDELPLIIRGPGAGPAVTAAGCFADLLQLVRYLGARS